MIKVILLLDTYSKKTTKLDGSVLNSNSVLIVNDLLSIPETALGETRTVVVLEGALHSATCYADLVLYKDLLALNYTFLVNDDKYDYVLRDLGDVYRCDLTVVDFELLQASLYKDAAYRKVTIDDDSCAVYAESVVSGDSVATQKERALAQSYLDAIHRESLLKSQLAEREEQLTDLAINNAKLSSENEKMISGCNTLLKRIAEHNQLLKRYETVFTQDVYTKLNLYDYPNRPIILYFKQFTEFIGEVMFLETLVDTLRYQKRKSVKVLQLFDSSGDRQIRLLPDYYHRLHNYYAITEVITNNYLCKSGDCSNLLDRLLDNKYGLDVLIIVDRKDHDDVMLSGAFPQFEMCRLPEQAQRLGLPVSTTIINRSVQGWHNWVPMDVSNLSDSEKFIKLSSRKVIQFILDTMEKFSNSF